MIDKSTMTGNPASLRVLALAGCVMCLGFLGATAAARAESFDFDIPAQRLSGALDRFADISHQSVLYRDEWVDGRTSSAVHGRYSALAALHLLLAGTGLAADDVRAGASSMPPAQSVASDLSGVARGAFVLTPDPATALAAPAGLARGYDALVQARVWQTLCEDTRTAPGTYRALLRVQVDASGTLRQARLLASTGDTRRDAAMTTLLTGLPIGATPPTDLAQPLTLMILPLDAMAQARACHGAP